LSNKVQIFQFKKLLLFFESSIFESRDGQCPKLFWTDEIAYSSPSRTPEKNYKIAQIKNITIFLDKKLKTF
jgi:hypothetical protein